MPLTGLNSFGVHLYGGTGVGKTTAMYCKHRCMGRPPRADAWDNDDTPNSRMNRGEVMCNLPLNSDEMTNMKGWGCVRVFLSISPKVSKRTVWQVAEI